MRHQMTRDQADAKVIRAVFGDKITEDTSPKLDEKEKAIAARFRKMLALRIPKDAVRHKMVNENIDKKIMIDKLTLVFIGSIMYRDKEMSKNLSNIDN